MFGSWFGKEAVGGVVNAAEGVANIIDMFVETDEEKQAAEILKMRMMMRPSLAQIELNKVEAGHRSIFVAGWRPAVGWVCAFALAWHFIIYDMFIWIQVNFMPHTTAVPQLTGTEELITVLMALLGMGALRTVEKMNGKTK
jgi:hypothetical protein